MRKRHLEDGDYGCGPARGDALNGAFQVERTVESLKRIANNLF